MKSENFFSRFAALTLSLTLAGCLGGGSNSGGGATLKIVNGESGCTLSQVYITPAGESRGTNLVANSGIGYNTAPRAFEVDPGDTYSVSVSSNTTTSNLDPEAECSVTLAPGETRVITYSYSGGPSLFYGTLSGCN